MNIIAKDAPGKESLLMGNEAIARGAVEAGVQVCAAYPGNPSSEIIGSLSRASRDLGIYVEWSVNEKVALEVVAAASLGGMRGLTAMKQNGLNVALDTLFVLNMTGSKGGLVVVVCDDPSALSSGNEEDCRSFAKMGDLPLFEPSTSQEAKDMTRWAFDLSEELGVPCLIRSVTRVSHQRGNVRLGEIPKERRKPHFDTSRAFIPLPVVRSHQVLHEKMDRCRERFEEAPFNVYRGPERPDLLVVTSGAGWMYTLEANVILGIEDRVGIVKLGTSWPLPERFLKEHLRKTDRILFVEEVDPFMEESIKAFWAQNAAELGPMIFQGRASGSIPRVGELTPDIVLEAIQKILKIQYEPRSPQYAEDAAQAATLYAPFRELVFCAGCPHRATFWAIKNALNLDGRDGIVLGDIGCYSLGIGSAGFRQIKTILAMGSGAGLGSGFGKFGQFGFEQPIIAVCGDSTFFHAAIPAIVNGRYNGSSFLMLVLDNNATAMTGFQPHPGTGQNAIGDQAPVVDMEALCKALGVEAIVQDPFDLNATTETIYRLLRAGDGVKVLILRQECALMRSRRGKTDFQVRVDQELCIGTDCGCNRLCTRVFKCPGLVWDTATGKSQVDEAICTNCGVCIAICPQSAIAKEAA